MRKKLQIVFLSALFFLLFAAVSVAQAPNSFNYQAIVRNASGEVIASKEVSLRLSINKGGALGTSVFVETHKPTTNSFGLVSFAIGSGTAVAGNISSVDWSADVYYLKVELDATGGSTFTELGVSQILSVPYALHAKESDNLKGSITESQVSDLKNYLTTETDPVFNTSPAQGITGSNITNWNSAFGWGNHAGLYRPAAWVPSWTDVTSKPSVFPPSAHLHSAAEITSGTMDVARIPTIEIGTKTSGTLSVSRGGTGATNFTPGNVLIGNGTGVITTSSRIGIDLRATFPPAAHTHTAADITAGIISVARGGTGQTSLASGKILVGNGADALLMPTNLHWDNTNNRLGIGTTSPTAMLHTRSILTGGGNVLFVGSYKTVPGDPPASGEGTRMMWYPDKAAFRAGLVSGDHWDKANIGTFSFAAGIDTKATGDMGSTAMGNGTTASGIASIAMGSFTTASGDWSTSIGWDSNASGIAATAVGIGTNASGSYSTAMGSSARATGNYSFAINLSMTEGPEVGANSFRVSGATSIGGNLGWTNHSDSRLKKEIQHLDAEKNLEKIMKLQGVRFKWKESTTGDDRFYLGFLAQDVLDILPEPVLHDELNDIYSIEYTAIIPVLVEGIKEQQAIINSQQKQINEMNALLEQLKSIMQVRQ